MRTRLTAVLLAAIAGPAAADASDPVLRAELSPRCALEVDIRNDERPACWRVDCVDAAPRTLGCDATALHQVADVRVAPGQQWMAVISVGEGHPMLEVVALSDWIAGQPYRAQCTINPYPGTIHAERWDDGRLGLASDVDLRIEDSGLRADGIGDERRYALDPASCALAD